MSNDESKVEPNELEEQDGELLPERAAMSIVDPAIAPRLPAQTLDIAPPPTAE
jgi:hypothetical protein